MKCKDLSQSEAINFAELFFHEAEAMVGQKQTDKDILLIGIKSLAEYLLTKCKGYTIKEIREALKYGQQHDKTQGGHIYAQRLIFWLKDYDTNQRTKLKLQQMQTPPSHQITQRSEMTKEEKLNFIENQRQLFLKNEIYAAAQVYDLLKELDIFSIPVEEKRLYLERAIDLKREALKSLLVGYTMQYAKLELQKLNEIDVDKINLNHLPISIVNDIKRLGVEDYFKSV